MTEENMSKLEELIQQYCPDGVEFKTIGEVCVVLTGGEAPDDAIKGKEPFGDCIYPIYSNGVGENALWGYASSYKIEKVSVTFSSIGTIGYPTIRKGYYTPIIRLKVIYPQDDSQLSVYYLKYALETVEFEKQKSSVPNINANMIKAISIPLPPLPVQEEIVRILDNFTELQAELQAELQKRKQQYNYYLDNLLNFKNINRGGYQAEVRWMKLKDVCMKTSNIKWKSTTGQYRYIDLSSVDIQTHSIISTIEIDKMSAPSRAQQIVQEDDVIFATTRPTQMRACIIPTQYNGDICSTGYCVLRVDTKILLPRFLFFSLTVSGFKTYLSNNLTLGNYPSISNNTLLEYEVPVPSLANQQRIVSILDRFDTLTTDLTQGLPAEIEKRRQQYEYYRDKLLTFKRKGA